MLTLAGLGFLLAGGAVLAWTAWVLFGGGEPPPRELLRPFAFIVLLLVLVLAAGLALKLRPRHYLAVDDVSGTATFIRGGAAARAVPLAELGPLEHVVEKRRVPSGKTWRLATFHVARSAPFPELVLLDSEEELATRRALEVHAKAWRVPYRKPSGEMRNPEDLDVPFFQRMGNDAEAREPLPQPPDSKLTVAWKDEGYEISTSYRPKVDRVRLAVTLAGPPVLFVFVFREPLLDVFRSSTPAFLRLAAAALFVLSFAPGLTLAAKAWRRATRPPAIRVSAKGIRFRGRSLPLAAIEEVERVSGGTCRFVSDDRIVEIDADFCEPTEVDWLQREVRRLVVEVGQRSPVA